MMKRKADLATALVAAIRLYAIDEGDEECVNALQLCIAQLEADEDIVHIVNELTDLYDGYYDAHDAIDELSDIIVREVQGAQV